MSDNLLLSNIWTFGAIVTVLLVGFVELGSRIGPRLHAQKKDEARRSQIGGVQGAVLGLLGCKRPKFLPPGLERILLGSSRLTQATCCAWPRRAAAKRAGVSSAACSTVALWGSRLITSVR